jgi:hypothetical protein
MRVYLDNNILIDIEDKKISLDIFKNIDKKYRYLYSYTHIQELLEYNKDLGSLKKIRLKTIFDLTNNAYIYPDNNQISSKIENPEKVINTLKLFAGLMDDTRQTVNNFNIDRTKLISLLGIDNKRINNYTPSEVIDYIDKAIRSRLLIGFDNLVDLSGISLHEKISALFNLLDFIGFWKDEKKERSNLARMYDSSHTYFASYCDLFVSNDKRARNKAKVAYLFNEIETKVLSLDEFLTCNK